MSPRITEIRCPIYGFVTLNDWEREIISHPTFQRLRRIRQLAWTDTVYPGAMHTRFEHSLGVMHMATQLYDGIVERCGDILKSDYGYAAAGFERSRQLVRLAALLHDVGHGPFSHAVESLAPSRPDDATKAFKHEDYSSAIIRECFRDLIQNHQANNNYRFSIDEVAGLIEGGPAVGNNALWRDLISGQLDADRMDYLLRDSYHAGVDYGRYDWRRLVASAELVEDVETGDYRFGVSAGGRHVAESLIIARYMMFSQVYFHKVRTVLDHHLHHAIEAILPDGRLPPPRELDAYLAWDDWRVLGAFANGKGGDHARRLKERDLYALVWETSEFPDENELARFADAEAALADFAPFAGDAGKSWYKTVRGEDLLVAAENPGGQTGPLSTCSGIVRHLNPSRCRRLYVAREHRQEAQARLSNPGGRGT